MMKIQTMIAAQQFFRILPANTIRPNSPIIKNGEYYYLNTSLISFLPDKQIND